MPEDGTVVTYQYARKIHDNGSGLNVFPAHDTIPCFSKTKVDGKFKDIGILGAVDINGIPVSETIRRENLYPAKNGGYYRLKIGSPDDNDMYIYLELASTGFIEGTDRMPYNGTPGEHCILIKKDFAADTKKANEIARKKRDAITHALSIKGFELERVGYLLGFGRVDDHEQLVNQVYQFATDNPDTYFLRVEDKLGEYKATMAQAIANDIVFINEEASCLAWKTNSAIILSLTKTDYNSAITEFAEYVKEDAKGVKMLEAVKKAIEVDLKPKSK